jgi:TonB family protein
VAVAAVDVPRGFQTLTPPEVILPDIPPPAFGTPINALDFMGEGIEGGRADGNPEKKEAPKEDLLLAPSVTPFTVRPELKNMQEVARSMERHYPSALRDAGIGGTVVLWFLIDDEGHVVKTALQRTSGYTQLDDAAAKVAPVMKFSPALNRDQRVMVWVELPITFRVQ